MMFFYKLDSMERDYWLDRAVSAWTAGKNIVVDHGINFAGNIIFGRKHANDGFVKALFKRGNLDYPISLLLRKLSDENGVLTFCRKQNPKSSIVEYRPVIKDGCRCGWTRNSAKNGQLWDNDGQSENTGGSASIDTTSGY
jgi:hypothetical protein